jgi:hypothetical protein
MVSHPYDSLFGVESLKNSREDGGVTVREPHELFKFFLFASVFRLEREHMYFFLVVDVDMKRFIVPGQWVHQQNEIQWTTATSQDYEREQASRWERGRFRGV